jgi:hypothetical protein
MKFQYFKKHLLVVILKGQFCVYLQWHDGENRKNVSSETSFGQANAHPVWGWPR